MPRIYARGSLQGCVCAHFGRSGSSLKEEKMPGGWSTLKYDDRQTAQPECILLLSPI